jgi:putative transcriptional regulator
MDNEIEQFCNDLLQSVQEMKTATTARKTEFVSQGDGTIRRLVTRTDSTIERNDVLSDITYTRLKSNLTQAQFAKLLGVSVRTLQEWEQGRKHPSGAAKTLLKVAKKHPDILQELMLI